MSTGTFLKLKEPKVDGLDAWNSHACLHLLKQLPSLHNFNCWHENHSPSVCLNESHFTNKYLSKGAITSDPVIKQ